MKKKVVAAMLLCMAIAVTGCSDSDAEDETASADAVEEAQDETAAEEEEEEQTAERPSYDALDYVTLGEYKGLEVTLLSTEVTEEEVEEEMQSQLSSSSLLETLEEGEVVDGDIANIDYVGTLDGEEFDGGSAEDYDLTIGSGTFIDGFEEGLIGVEIGSTVDLDLTFPEDYSAEDLAGQDVVFTVTVHSVQRVPELTDDVAAALAEETEESYTTVEEFRQFVLDTLTAEKESTQISQMANDLVGLALENATINGYPQEMIDYELDSAVAYYAAYAEYYGMEYEDFLEGYLGMSEDEFIEEMTASIESSMDTEMLLLAIAETEGCEVTDEEYQTRGAQYAEDYDTDLEELESYYGVEEIRVSMLEDMAVEVMQDYAVFLDADETEAE